MKRVAYYVCTASMGCKKIQYVIDFESLNMKLVDVLASMGCKIKCKISSIIDFRS